MRRQSANRAWQDVRFSFRLWRRDPFFAAVVCLTLAVGIGANTAMFTVVNAILLKPLPYQAPDRLVFMRSRGGGVSESDFIDLRQDNAVFTTMATFSAGVAVVASPTATEQVSVLRVSRDFLKTVGILISTGRSFLPEEEEHPTSVVMISTAIWRRTFGSDPEIVGKSIRVDGELLQVVGIVPPILDAGLTADVFRPLVFTGASRRVDRILPVLGRLRAGMTLSVAAGQLNSLAANLGRLHPEDAGQTLVLQRYSDVIVANARSKLAYLFGAVGLVLFIAWGNVSTLLLAKASARRGEMLTRVAIGATRAQLMQQVLIESAGFAVVGGVGGAVLGSALLAMVNAGSTVMLPAAGLRFDSASVLFVATASLVTAMATGWLAAARVTSDAIQPALSAHSRGASSGNTRTRRMVVSLQVAASFILMTGALALLVSYRKISGISLGFDPDNVLTARIALPENGYSWPEAHKFWTDLLSDVSRLPGVRAASAATRLPIASLGGNARYVTADNSAGPNSTVPTAQINWVADSFFETMGIPIVAGNSLTSKTTDGESVVVVSASLAAHHFGPILGESMRFPDFNNFSARVIGIAGDVRASGLGAPAPEIVYFNTRQMHGDWRLILLVRTAGDPHAAIPAIRRLVFRRDQNLALGNVRTIAEVLGRSTAETRLETVVLASFAIIALAMATFGLYALLAYTVAARETELSIRCALGAPRSRLFRLIVTDGLSVVAAGLGAGLLVLVAVVGWWRSQFASSVPSAALIATTTGIIALAGLVAAILPALTASRATARSVDSL